MATWSSKRKTLYGLAAIVIVAALVVVPAWKLFYKAPSCFDGVKNGDEQGIDCGGSCTKLCTSDFLVVPPASWVRFRQAAPHVYNLAAYIVNPNPNAGAKAIPYSFSVLDKDGIELASPKGTFDLPLGRDTIVFRAAVRLPDQQPARAIFSFGDPQWYVGQDPLRSLQVAGKQYSESTSTGSALDATLMNTSVLPMGPIDVYAVLKDADGNVIDFSKTVVDSIAPQGTALAPFTWPDSHSGKVISIDVLSVPE